MMARPRSDELTEYFKSGVETGVALSQWIKRQNPSICIVGISGISHREVSGSWFTNNANGLIAKPFSSNPKELFSLVKKIRK